MVDTPAVPHDVSDSTGTRIFIGPAAPFAVDTQSEFAALTPYIEIGLVDTLGEFGGETTVTKATPLGDGIVRKSKGPTDQGTLALVCFHDPIDAGQIALAAAAAPSNRTRYAIKVILPDAPDAATYSNTTIYFRGLVTSRRFNVGAAGNTNRRAFSIEIDSVPIEILAALLS
jgi:hypothetical protein